MKILPLLFCLFFVLMPSTSQNWKTYPFVPDNSLISFPLDEGRHENEPVEWWYSVGHFTGKTSGTAYSYMLCYFYTQQFFFDGFRIFSLCNEETGEFITETLPLQYSFLSTNSLNINAITGVQEMHTESWKNVMDSNEVAIPFSYIQTAETEKFAINFKHEALKSPLLVADSGYLHIGKEEYSYYYSQTRNLLSGTLTINGETEEIEGTSWFDRQYGNFSSIQDNQYEWFCIQLSNNIELLVYNVFTSNGQLPDLKQNKILSLTDSQNTQYTTSDFSIERLTYKFTEDEQRCYSQKWRIRSESNNIDLICSALHITNEVQLPVRFFEGAIAVSGKVNGQDVTGKGFAELVHHYEMPEVIFQEPDFGNSDTVELNWKIVNKDDGNPLNHTLSYTLNYEKKLNLITQNITDTVFKWKIPELKHNDHLQIHLESKSIDGTLYTRDSIAYTKLSSFSRSINEDLQFKIYPNPANESIHIKSEKNVSIEVYTIMGKKIFHDDKSTDMKQLDTSDLPSGIYVIHLSHKDVKASKRVQIKH